MRLQLIVITIICYLLSVSTLFTESLQDDDVNRFFANYYKNPEPERVPYLLGNLLQSERFFKDDPAQKNVQFYFAYIFGRIAQLEPALIDEYKDLFMKTSHNGRVFMLKVFQICGDKSLEEYLIEQSGTIEFEQEKEDILQIIEQGVPVDYDPIAHDVKAPADLDFLWTEFMISGNEKAVIKIIDVLDWNDINREKLEIYLESDVPQNEKDEIISLLRNDFGIQCDPETNKVLSKGDIDLAIVHFLNRNKKDRNVFIKIKKVLELGPDEVFYAATKGSAEWSLGSNARQHDAVAELCKRSVEARPLKSKTVLLRILAQLNSEKRDIDQSEKRYVELSRLLPYDINVLEDLGNIYTEKKDVIKADEIAEKLKTLDQKSYTKLMSRIDLLRLESLNVDNARKIFKEKDVSLKVKDIISRNLQVPSYRTKMVLVDYSKPLNKNEFFTVEWDMIYERPDKYLIDQIAWEKKGLVADRWITIDDENYFMIGVWFKEPKGSDWRSSTNKLLVMAKWCYLLEEDKRFSYKIYKAFNKKFIVIDFSPEDVSDFWREEESVLIDTAAQIWIEYETKYIAKAILTLQGQSSDGEKINISFTQIFGDYNTTFNIKKPETYESLKENNIKK